MLIFKPCSANKTKEFVRGVDFISFLSTYFGMGGRGRGMRVVKEVEADEIITKEIGLGARERAKELGIKLRVIKNESEIKNLIS